MKNKKVLSEWKQDKGLLRNIKLGMRDLKVGRTYVMACGTRYGKCKKSKHKTSTCSECLVDDCERWYKLGKKDERNLIYKQLQKNLHNADIWNLPCKDYEHSCINCQFWRVVEKTCKINR